MVFPAVALAYAHDHTLMRTIDQNILTQHPAESKHVVIRFWVNPKTMAIVRALVPLRGHGDEGRIDHRLAVDLAVVQNELAQLRKISHAHIQTTKAQFQSVGPVQMPSRRHLKAHLRKELAVGKARHALAHGAAQRYS